MKKNTAIPIIALIVLAVLGAGAGFFGLKKWREHKRKQNQEFKYEYRVGQGNESFDAEAFKKMLLINRSLDEIIKEHDLTTVWAVDVAGAKEKIAEKCTIRHELGEVFVSYQDKDKELSEKILKSIVVQFQKRRAGM
ncbi:MAG: hypothetical protein ACPG32_12710 [Akkermansiaceae bacterium]